MDPASIAGLVGTCVAIGSSATGFIKGLNDLKTRYKDVQINSHALITQTAAVRSAVSSIQRWLARNGSHLGRKERKSVRDSLEACGIIIHSMLEGVREVLGERSRGSTRWKFWDRVKFLWEQDQMDQYAVRLDHQVAALSLHLQALHLPEGRAIIRNGLAAASSIAESLHSGSAASLIRSNQPLVDREREPFALGALTAKNLAVVEQEDSESPGSGNAGPSNEVDEATLQHGKKEDKGKQREVAPESILLGRAKSQDTSDIRSALDEIRTVIADSAAGESSKKRVKTTLERLTDLMKNIGRMLRNPTNRSTSEISDLDQEANDLFAELAEILRNLEDDAEEAIFSALAKKDLAEVNRLLENEADVQAVNEFGQSALHVAVQERIFAREDKIVVVEALVRKGGQLEALDLKGRTVMHAIDFENSFVDANGVLDMVDCLLKLGADPEANLEKEGTILHRATYWSHLATTELLLIHGVDIEARSQPWLETPLHLACISQRPATTIILKRLLKAGADTSARTKEGKSALSLACSGLVKKEKALKDLEVPEERLMSAIYRPCLYLRNYLNKILTLLEYTDTDRISIDSRDVRKTFVFRNIQNWDRLSRDYLRYELEDQRVFALLSSDEELYHAVRDFYQGGKPKTVINSTELLDSGGKNASSVPQSTK
ncbi:ankyrin [Mollisia scopiformis]|uniref:Ankyrin n=1 Tax=Mollisia scopiformis TaxID=149040 RepID=A0A132B985_MOLSC|nr:ankyrin [Mollisia scopiformis]KUJ08434.1 ankyrin [Mollisia scopiformis]